MFWPLALLDLDQLMPTRQWHNTQEVLQEWRSDALEILRHDVPRIVVILIITIVLLWILRAITRRLRALSKRQELPSGLRAQQLNTLAGVIKGFGLFVIIFSALIQILGVLNIDVKPLIASAGVVGLAIGFGAQTLVKDVINGFFILLENQYDIGDVVRLGTVQGTVEEMTLRRTVLRDGDGTVHTVPNSEIKIVSNLTRDWTQVALQITVAYTENSDRVIQVLRDLAQEVWNDPELHDLLVALPEVPGIDRVSGSDVDYLMLVKTRPGNQFRVTREMRRRIKACFEKNNIQPGTPGKMYVIDARNKS